MIKFNSNHIVVGEIKQLLKSFNLPKCRVWKEGMDIFENMFYIKDNALWVGKDNTLKKLYPYVYGQSLQHLTHNLIIDSIIYDSYTHKYLGDFLRFYRDFHNINLMSMYNCFSNESPKGLSIETKKFKFDTTNTKFKVYMVPIKWYSDYTIGIESGTLVELFVGLYDNGDIIPFNLNDREDVDLYNKTYQKISGTFVNKPFLYTKAKNYKVNKYLYTQEKNLKLFIKVPANTKTSITVLEGDFLRGGELHFKSDTDFATRRIMKTTVNYESGVGLDGEFKYKGAMVEREYITQPQLLRFNTVESYPFADRLIEYLFENAITPVDEIAENTSRIQQRLVQRHNTTVKVNNDIIHRYLGIPYIIGDASTWTTHLRNVIYDIAQASNISSTVGMNKYDLLGYVDKDTERLIGEYQEMGGNK